MRIKGSRKTIDANIQAGFPSGGDGERWELSAYDNKSGLMIFQLTVSKAEFFDMLRCMGGTPATVEIFDQYHTWGKQVERERVIIQDERLKSVSRDQFNLIINDHRTVFDVDGWKLEPVGGVLSQGQLNTREGTLWVFRARYLEPTPAD